MILLMKIVNDQFSYSYSNIIIRWPPVYYVLFALLVKNKSN